MARAFAREGARVHLTGRRLGTIDVAFGRHAAAYGISANEFAAMMSDRTHRKRATTLEELAEVAAFVASDRAAAITGAVANVTGGFIVD